MKPLHIANSSLSNTIYCGNILKAGIWASNKQDLTTEALVAVAEHVENFGKPVTLTGKDDIITITVTRSPVKK
jgi:hypothetical protein